MNANIKYLIAVVAMISSVAHASSGDESASSNTNLTRDQVRAEVIRARAAGELYINDTNYPFTPKVTPSMLTRDQVRIETDRARAAGELDWSDTSYPLTAHASTAH